VSPVRYDVGSVSQRMAFLIVTAVKTSSLTYFCLGVWPECQTKAQLKICGLVRSCAWNINITFIVHKVKFAFGELEVNSRTLSVSVAQ
jgi:hypothetical protein